MNYNFSENCSIFIILAIYIILSLNSYNMFYILKDLYNNILFKILFLSLITFLISYNIQISLLIIFIFINILDIVYTNEIQSALNQMYTYKQYENFKAKL
jgi:hypothetical protein